MEVHSVDVVETYDEEVAIPGTSVTTPAKAVTVDLSYSVFGEDRTETTTLHLFDVGGQWRWTHDEDGVSECVS
jgi:hypothetical protein